MVATRTLRNGLKQQHDWHFLRHGQVVFLITASAMSVVCGCAHDRDDPVEMTGTTGIDIGIRNTGPERFERASVQFGEYRFSAGILVAGGEAVHVCSGEVIPESAEVFFELKDGRVFEKTIDVKTHLRAGFHGEATLFFTIDGNHDVSVELEGG